MARSTVSLSDLKAHVGELLRLKTRIYWWGDRGWDAETDRIYLLLDASKEFVTCVGVTEAIAASGYSGYYYVSVLVDGIPRWIQTHMNDFELIHGDAK